MKRFFVPILILMFFVSCSMDSTDDSISNLSGNTSEASRIVGTWKSDVDEVIFTFNANSKFSFNGTDVLESQKREGDYMVINSELILRTNGSRHSDNPRALYLSNDGRFLMFSYSYYSLRTGSTVSGNLWLIKQ